MKQRIIKASELKLGDVIRLVGHDGKVDTSDHMDMTVIQIEDNFATVVRPYIHLGDFIHTGGVTPYIGMEKIQIGMGTNHEYFLVDNNFRPRYDSDINSVNVRRE